MDISLIEQVRRLRTRLGEVERSTDPGVLIDLVSELEMLKSAACAAQAAATVAFDAARRKAEAIDGVPAARQGRGVAAEIALARRESPHRGQVLVGFAKVLTSELPHTQARLAAGELNEWRAMILARETACLTPLDRLRVDEDVCADPQALDGLGTGQLIKRTRALACRLDPAAVAGRARRAEADRCVSIRPAPDTMSYLTATLPVAHGVTAYATLSREADTLRAAGDPRSKGQLMADLLVGRIIDKPRQQTSHIDQAAEEPVPEPVPVTLNVTMSDATLAGGHRPGEVSAPGVAPIPIPAETARLLVANAINNQTPSFFRRLYYNPLGRLVAMSSRQRFHRAGLADFLSQRDLGICRTPYCDAPIRHYDHIVAHHQGGATSADNGQGLCEACNHAKQAPHWSQQALDDDLRHTVETVTPTGHRYYSHAPPPPGHQEPRWVKIRSGVYTLSA